MLWEVVDGICDLSVEQANSNDATRAVFTWGRPEKIHMLIISAQKARSVYVSEMNPRGRNCFGCRSWMDSFPFCFIFFMDDDMVLEDDVETPLLSQDVREK